MVAVSLIVCGYSMDGLRGAGVALSLAAAFDLLLVWTTAHKLYGFSLQGKAVKMLLIQLLFGFLTFGVTLYAEGFAYWLLGGLCFLGSGMISVRILLGETTLLHSLAQKLKNRLGRK